MLTEPGITRKEIAYRLGVKADTLRKALERYRIVLPHEPPPKYKPPKPRKERKFIGYIPNPMETALSEPDCIRMRRFLSCLTTYADRYPRRVDVNRFIVEYRKSRAWDKEI